MAEENGIRRPLWRIVPRVAKAAAWAAFYIILLNSLPLKSLPAEVLGELAGFAQNLIIILLVFAVAGSLTSGTILAYAFGFAKGLTLIAFTWITLNGGLLTLTFPSGGGAVTFTLDFTVYLTMFLLAELLGVARNVVQALDLLSRRVERSETP